MHTALPTALRRIPKASKTPETLTISKWSRTEKEYIDNKRSPSQNKLIALFDSRPTGIWQDAIKLMGFSVSQLNNLEKKGFLKKESIDPLSAELDSRPALATQSHTLNEEQLSAVEKLASHNQHFSVHLIHGVTGSGKTEVYIEIAKKHLSTGKQVLILIPEINLTPQTLSRFQSQLESAIGLIHSSMTDKEKLTMWHLAKKGIARIIIGTRSAIFTPFADLGLIIIDEEHDSSYKQNEGFRYSARDLAVKRAQIENIPVILGSATPSLESLLNAKQHKYHYLTLKNRAGDGQPPSIQLIDIKSRAIEHGCSRPLIARIRTELNNNNQVILFQNRRGYSPTLLCDNCGWIAQCPNCDARLTLHSKPIQLHCHHCDFKAPLMHRCTQCHSNTLKPIGTGTERIEVGLAGLFPNTRIIRIDRDNIKKQHDLKQLLDEINSGIPCILIGTQMLAKGHDFHNVTLVAIIDADNSLFSSDFRAFEQSTQLMLQVAGRAGRGAKPGSVLIQTKYAEHALFEPIIANDYNLAAIRELEDRQASGLPPFSKMIAIRAESADQTINEHALLQLKYFLVASLKQAQLSHHFLAGPFEAAMARKSGIYRSYLHIFTTHTHTRQHLQQILPDAARSIKTKAKIIIDVDPQEYI